MPRITLVRGVFTECKGLGAATAAPMGFVLTECKGLGAATAAPMGFVLTEEVADAVADAP